MSWLVGAYFNQMLYFYFIFADAWLKEEELDQQKLQISPPGFHLLFLPFADDFRKIAMEENLPRGSLIFHHFCDHTDATDMGLTIIYLFIGFHDIWTLARTNVCIIIIIIGLTGFHDIWNSVVNITKTKDL